MFKHGVLALVLPEIYISQTLSPGQIRIGLHSNQLSVCLSGFCKGFSSGGTMGNLYITTKTPVLPLSGDDGAIRGV